MEKIIHVSLDNLRFYVEKPPSTPPRLCIDNNEFFPEEYHWCSDPHIEQVSSVVSSPFFHQMKMHDRHVFLIFRTKIIPSWIRMKFFRTKRSITAHSKKCSFTFDVLEQKSNVTLKRNKETNHIIIDCEIVENVSKYCCIEVGYDTGLDFWKPSYASYYVKIVK
ncbi:MAG: hypothetical protein J6M18_04350 [Actinomycetaceae bacterium]|nr:hypothetical protein [Actinomycetaceae bacterium]